MELIDILHGIVEDSMNAYGLSDLTVGTVSKTNPLEVVTRETMAPLPQEVLWLTAAVVEKKIPILEHEHVTAGFRHDHTVTVQEHTHSAPEGETGPAGGGTYHTSEALTPDAYTSDRRLSGIMCYEDGQPLPVENGFIILNRGLSVGDKVLLLRVLRGQQFVILSRIFERRAAGANIAAIKHRLLAGNCVPGSAVPDLDCRPGDPPAERQG